MEFFIWPPTELEREHVRQFDAEVRNARETIVRESMARIEKFAAHARKRFAPIIEDTERLQRENVVFAIEKSRQSVLHSNTSIREALKKAFTSDRAYDAFVRQVGELAREWRA
jgi:hypothetical protein